MDDVIKESGRTILFVSHNMSALQNLCSRSILLNKGTVMQVDTTSTVIDTYLKTMTDQAQGTGPFPTEIPGFVVQQIKMTNQPSYQSSLTFLITTNTTVAKKDVTIELHILNTQMNRIMTGKVVLPEIIIGESAFKLQINNPQLPPGNYSLDISMHTSNTGFFYKQQVLFFEILPGKMDDPFVIQRKDTLGVYPDTTYTVDYEPAK